MNISICFVIYFPEQTILERIKIAYESGYIIYIYDNSPKVSFVRNFCKELSNCKYLTCGKNVGLGFGISNLCGQAFYEGSDTLLFFDQDTCFTKETLNYIDGFYQFRKNEFKSFAAIQFSNNINNQESNFDKFILETSSLLISSGSLFNLKALEKINWHNTTYFVDGVDYEFCLRAKINGFLLGKSTHTPGFDHITGQADKLYSIFNHKLYLRAYNPGRIKDILNSYLKLLILSIRFCKFQYTKTFVKSLMIFSFFQILVRILNILKIK